MKIFEVGFICLYEGGHGVLIGVEDDPFELTKLVICEQVNTLIEYWTEAESIIETEYEEDMRTENLLDLMSARNKAIEAETIEDLNNIVVDELSLICIVRERKVRTE